jgi:D-glycero-alpha-D-manno-heptose 1-phosphate guanylyltransferase
MTVGETMSQYQSSHRLSLTALILAGGRGERLRSVVSDRPKPMALVDGVPFLEILIRSLAAKGVKDFVLLTGYMGGMIEEYFKEPFDGSLSIRLSQESRPLGTGGAVKIAESMASDPSLLVNGDTFFDGDLDSIVYFHKEQSAVVTLSLYPVDDVSRYGSVEVDRDGRITGFREKAEGAGPGLINAGLSVLSGEFIRSLPDGPFSMEQEIFPALVKSGRMFGLCMKRPFFDIGTPKSYSQFKNFVEQHPEYFSSDKDGRIK